MDVAFLSVGPAIYIQVLSAQARPRCWVISMPLVSRCVADGVLNSPELFHFSGSAVRPGCEFKHRPGAGKGLAARRRHYSQAGRLRYIICGNALKSG
jgi:hypothetical protein